MKKGIKITILSLLGVALIAWLTAFISAHDIAVLEPKGLIGEKERDLIIISSLLMLIVIIPVFIFTWVFSHKYREGNKDAKYTPDEGHSTLAEVLWWGIPFVIIIALASITWITTHELNPFASIKGEKDSLRVEVVALDWKWLFIYPDKGIATVNYLQIPEKTEIAFEITSDAPMNSFWIPQLGGQIYAMPAMRSKLHLVANEVGTYRGASANISGKGFAGMSFKVVSSTEEDFDQWVREVRNSSKRLDAREYEELLIPSEYNQPTFYRLEKRDLFDAIIEKYHQPAE